jgi:hypothetical protein
MVLDRIPTLEIIKVKYYRGYHGSQQRNIATMIIVGIMMIEEIIIKRDHDNRKEYKKTR